MSCSPSQRCAAASVGGAEHCTTLCVLLQRGLGGTSRALGGVWTAGMVCSEAF